ncbi:MAG: nucleotidyl transferase AbiEii/AbiGii toxin family protein [Gammaproteobacteria bacterium]
MLRVLPHVAAQECFALKGGTAINLFLRDMPRLSVDIDLTYLPVEVSRETALRNISEALDQIAAEITKAVPRVRVHKTLRREPPDARSDGGVIAWHLISGMGGRGSARGGDK